MAPNARASYDAIERQRAASVADAPNKDLQLARAFVAAGGHLQLGTDAAQAQNVPGFANLRGLTMLVDAGFTPVEAIKIATSNGAQFLKVLDTVGTIAPGKAADLVLIKGNPAANIRDIGQIEMVFKDGVGYDPGKLLESVRSQYGYR
jgi:imidazolonepropionase-like amidohydrolase